MDAKTLSKKRSSYDRALVLEALVNSFRKLDPRVQVRNPVMFVVWIGALLTLVLFFESLAGMDQGAPGFTLAISLLLWFTVVFANFAEALAEGRGRAQADTLRKARQEVLAHKLAAPERDAATEDVASGLLRKGDVVLVEAGELIPADGEVIAGAASVDESAITGESAPVIRESGGDRSAVTGGTRVLSDWLVVRVTTEPGETFLDRMIAMVEGAKRQKTPNEIALNILLASLTIIFLVVVIALQPLSSFSVAVAGKGEVVTIAVLAALLVCLAPTTIGALLSAIGIAGMNRLSQANVVAMSGRAVEAAGDVDVLLLDKTGTITLGNRQAAEFVPAPGVGIAELADAAQLASLADETPEGRSIVVLAKNTYGLRGRDLEQLHATFVPFTAQTRMSGADFDGREIRKGAADAVETFVAQRGGRWPVEVQAAVQNIAKQGGTPLVVADGGRVLGVIFLKDIVKGGIHERFQDLRRMGIRTVMITGDNPVTAASIAAEAGVDDFLAEATPEAKLESHPRLPDRGTPRSHDRRRHQRRARARPGRRGCGHEHRHPGCQGGRQHGRPRLQPHQVARDRPHRQADAHDPRVADHLQHRQRHRQVLRHNPRGVRGHVSPAQHPQHHAPPLTVERHPVGGDLQRRQSSSRSYRSLCVE